jgi:hypothetical protein
MGKKIAGSGRPNPAMHNRTTPFSQSAVATTLTPLKVEYARTET